ncbi:unnamed protein product [Lampetra planeri]
MSKLASKRRNPPSVSSDDEAEQDVIHLTAPVAGAPSVRSEDVLVSAQETMASPTLPPPPQSWLDIAGHRERLLSGAAHLFEQMTAASTTGHQDVHPANLVSEATGARDLAAISEAAAALPKSAILRDRTTPQQQLPISKGENAYKLRRLPPVRQFVAAEGD